MTEFGHRAREDTGNMPGSVKTGTYTCQIRGQHVDKSDCNHVLPLSRGGKSTMDNLVAACLSSNCSKHDKTPEEWRETNGDV